MQELDTGDGQNDRKQLLFIFSPLYKPTHGIKPLCVPCVVV